MSFFNDVYDVVAAIPKGKVASYGTIARLCGKPRMAKQVGWALHSNPDSSSIPCHRVVNREGRCSIAFAFGGINRQRELLKEEGVEFLDNGLVDMAKYSIEEL